MANGLHLGVSFDQQSIRRDRVVHGVRGEQNEKTKKFTRNGEKDEDNTDGKGRIVRTKIFDNRWIVTQRDVLRVGMMRVQFIPDACAVAKEKNGENTDDQRRKEQTQTRVEENIDDHSLRVDRRL